VKVRATPRFLWVGVAVLMPLTVGGGPGRGGAVSAQGLPEPLPPVVTPTAAPRAGAAEPVGLPAGQVLPALVQEVRARRADLRAPLVRVMLSVPQPPVLPEPGRRYVVWSAGAAEVVRGPISLRVEGEERPGLQAGAFRARENAEAEAERLARAGFETAVRAGEGGLFRVIVVARRGENAEMLRARLAAAGVRAVVRAGGGGSELVLTGEGGMQVRGRELRLVPFDADPVRLGERVYRGEFVLAPAPQGVQVVNVLHLEEYLRGVVPAEMGPRSFPELEALKAQAVAARTYTVAHLGGGGPAGYDICDTQSCQVYGGTGVEHPLSDEAVRATAGLIATFGGAPIDAMYHSTCGGHTEAAAEQFPRRAAAYLVGVPCRGETAVTVGTPLAGGAWVDGVGRLAEVARRAAAAAGVPAEAGALAAALAGTGRRGVGREGLAAVFGLAESSLLLGEAAGVRGDWPADLLALARLELPPSAGEGREPEEALALVVRLAQLAGVVRELAGRVTASGEFLADDGTRYALAGGQVSVMARRGGAWRGGDATTLPGAPATLWLQGGRPLLAEVEVRSAADEGSSWSWWTREFSAAEVARACEMSGVERVEVVRRSISGRVTVLALHRGRERKEMRGIDFRYALGLPDNRFVVLPLTRGKDVTFRFLGRGWGHGVGMCQNGAFGLARGGASFEEILKTYYRGIEVVRWQGSGPAGGA